MRVLAISDSSAGHKKKIRRERFLMNPSRAYNI